MNELDILLANGVPLDIARTALRTVRRRNGKRLPPYRAALRAKVTASDVERARYFWEQSPLVPQLLKLLSEAQEYEE